MNEPSISIETLTPEWARKELQEQEKRIANGDYTQRTVGRGTVARYANDMKHGNWRINDQGISFDDKGNLKNGRHRLWAIVQANVPVKMLVLRGVESGGSNGSSVSYMDTLDCGRARGVANQLQIDGMKNSLTMAAAARAIGLCFTWPDRTSYGIIPVRQILKIYHRGMDVIFHKLQTAMARGAFLGPLAIYHEFRPRKAVEFAEQYASLIGLTEGSPVLALKKYIGANVAAGTDRTMKLVKATALALHHYDKGETVNSLRHTDLAVDWFRTQQKQNCKAVREILGLEE